jgi:predicted nuclease with TOPRIM domain
MTEASDPRQELKQKLEEIMGKLNLKQEDDEDDDQNFIKKDEAQVGEVKPESNQQRNLDRETGGLEEEEQKETGENDVWDDRSEEVDKMGSTDTFNTTSMKSVVWKQKKDRLAKKRAAQHHSEAAGVAVEVQSKSKGKSFDEMGYVERLRNLKQDRSHENQGGRGI